MGTGVAEVVVGVEVAATEAEEEAVGGSTHPMTRCSIGSKQGTVTFAADSTNMSSRCSDLRFVIRKMFGVLWRARWPDAAQLFT